MRGLIKHIVSATYKPLLVKYLATTRTYSYKGIHLEIPPQVFHPGFFFSTKLLLRYISKEHFSDKTFLELGAGSGLLSIYAAKRGASVMATDINPVSIECINLNTEQNAVKTKTILSDVFDNVSPRHFDYILINPPYYKKKPSSFRDYAWYCGENGEYFQKLFKKLAEFMDESSNVLMVLCDGCDLQMIKFQAAKNSFSMKCVLTYTTIMERNYIFKIEQCR
jgi:release factor glutamine methyltransferase